MNIIFVAYFIISIIFKFQTMATLADLQTAIQTIKDGLTKTSSDLQTLISKLPTTGGLSQADLDTTVSDLNNIATNLKGLDTTIATDTPA